MTIIMLKGVVNIMENKNNSSYKTIQAINEKGILKLAGF